MLIKCGHLERYCKTSKERIITNAVLIGQLSAVKVKTNMADNGAEPERTDLITELFAAVTGGNITNVKFILNNDFSTQTFKNLSPTLLHQAANNKHSQILNYLIESGSYVDSKNAQQMTAFTRFCTQWRCSFCSSVITTWRRCQRNRL